MNRNVILMVSSAVSLLCGLCVCAFGSITAVVSQTPNADINIFGSSDPTTALVSGLGILCVGIIFILVGAVGGFFAFRSRQA